jgi:predicted metallopeptidase
MADAPVEPRHEIPERASTLVHSLLARYEGGAGISELNEIAVAALNGLAAQARTAAVEEAAKIADSEALDYGALYVLEGFPEDLKRQGAAERVAKLIRRALARPTGESGK